MYCVQEPVHNSAVEEFTRRVSEVANQASASDSASKSNFVSKNVEVPATTASSNNQPHSNAISTINNNTVKSEILNDNENKNLGSEIVESNETPVVSAISDSPVVVPKMPINVKQIQKSMELIQPLAVDNKNLPNNKQQKQNKNKPVVPQDEIEKQSDNVNSIVPQTLPVQAVVTSAPAQSSATLASPVNVSMSSSTLASASTNPITSVIVPPAPTAAPSTVPSTSVSAPAPASVPAAAPAPQPQRIREPRERMRSEDKDKSSAAKANLPDNTPKPNGPTSVGKYLLTINVSIRNLS